MNEIDAFLSSLGVNSILGQEIVPVEIDPIDLEISERLSAVTEVKRLISDTKESLQAADLFKAEQLESIQELQRKARELQHAIDTNEMKVQEDRIRLRRAEYTDLARAEAALRDAQERKRMVAELEMLREQFDIVTAGAPWREWAKQHQLDGARSMAMSRRTILADKMGLGKTLTAIAACDMLQAKKILVVCPSDVMSNFQHELKRWAPHRKTVILGGRSKAERRGIVELMQTLPQVVALINYEAWRKDLAFLTDLVDMQFDTIIFDEAHTFKEMSGVTWDGVYKLVFTENLGNDDSRVTDGWFGHCSVKNVFPMTGTTILNKPQDLYPLLCLIMPARFRPDIDGKRNFLASYCERGFTNKWKFLPGGLNRLVRELDSKFIMRDRKQAGITLPPQEIQIYNLDLTSDSHPNQYEACMQLSKYAALKIDEGRAANIMYIIALITRKRQALVWPDGISFNIEVPTEEYDPDVAPEFELFKVKTGGESIVIDRVIRNKGDEWDGFIPDFTNEGERDENGKWTGERVVVFSQFKDALKEIERRCNLAGISVVRYDGDTSDDIKLEVKTNFDRYEIEQNNVTPKWQVVLANYKTGGVGLNFTDATQTVIVDEEWNPGKRDQAYARTQRMGQTEETGVHIIRVRNSISEWMADVIGEKEEMIDGFESQVNLYEEMKKRLQDGDML